MIARVSAPGSVARGPTHPAATGRQRDAVSFHRLSTTGEHPTFYRMRLDHPDDHPDDPSESVQSRLDRRTPSNVSRPDPSGAIQADAEHPTPSLSEGRGFGLGLGDGRTAVLGHAAITPGAGAGVEAVGPALTSRRREDRVSSGHGRNRSEGQRPRPGPRAPEGGLFRRTRQRQGSQPLPPTSAPSAPSVGVWGGPWTRGGRIGRTRTVPLMPSPP
jgi:hypothetical protein